MPDIDRIYNQNGSKYDPRGNNGKPPQGGDNNSGDKNKYGDRRPYGTTRP